MALRLRPPAQRCGQTCCLARDGALLLSVRLCNVPGVKATSACCRMLRLPLWLRYCGALLLYKTIIDAWFATASGIIVTEA